MRIRNLIETEDELEETRYPTPYEFFDSVKDNVIRTGRTRTSYTTLQIENHVFIAYLKIGRLSHQKFGIDISNIQREDLQFEADYVRSGLFKKYIELLIDYAKEHLKNYAENNDLQLVIRIGEIHNDHLLKSKTLKHMGFEREPNSIPPSLYLKIK